MVIFALANISIIRIFTQDDLEKEYIQNQQYGNIQSMEFHYKSKLEDNRSNHTFLFNEHLYKYNLFLPRMYLRPSNSLIKYKFLPMLIARTIFIVSTFYLRLYGAEIKIRLVLIIMYF